MSAAVAFNLLETTILVQMYVDRIEAYAKTGATIAGHRRAPKRKGQA
jgi:hypothetical protein